MSSASHYDLNASKPALDSPLLAHDTLGRSSSHEGNESQTKETEPESAIPALKGSLKSRNSNGALHFNSPLKLAKALLLPVIAVAYMAFCFVVNERVVTVGNKNDSFQHISSLKAATTSVTILIIWLGLTPLKSLIQDLKSEEFFRTLSYHPSGVPVLTLNKVSNPSFGTYDTIITIIRRHCTPHFVVAFLVGLLALATSTIAPAALSLGTKLIDGDVVAFAVGAIPKSSVFNASAVPTDFFGATDALSTHDGQASSIAWAETALGLHYSFQFPGNLESGAKPYIIPTPIELSTSVTAHWISDVIALDPSCQWLSSSPAQFSFAQNISMVGDVVLNFPDMNFNLTIQGGTTFGYGNSFILLQDFTTQILNLTTNDPPSDGSTIWILAQCLEGTNCGNENTAEYTPIINFNLSDIPTTKLNALDENLEFSVLMCQPGPTIETHEVQSNGTGFLSIASDERQHKPQNNLDKSQTPIFLSFLFSQFASAAGPQFGSASYSYVGSGSPLSFGSQSQVGLIFGADAVANTNVTGGLTTLTPLPLNNITAAYTRILQSSAKSFMSGILGTAYVPGRVATEALIFTSDRQHVIASVVLFVILSLVVIAAHFRAGKDEHFSLFALAASLHGSDIPQRFADLKETSGSSGLDEQRLIGLLGGRSISLAQNEDGSSVLRLT